MNKSRNTFIFFVNTKSGDKMNILITGARSGIGFDVGLRLANNKNNTIYMGTHTEKEQIELSHITKFIDNINVIKLDINYKEDIEKINLIDIDVLICNAAIGIGGSIINTSIDKLEENFKTNLFDNFRLIQIAINNMLKKNSGKIIITSSIAGLIPIPYLGFYCSTKASISMLASCLRLELKNINSNIQISLIEPGIYNTGFNDVMLDMAYENTNNKSVLVEKQLFNKVGKSNLNSITNKYIMAVYSKKAKKVYRAPLSIRIIAKLYLILFK